MNSVCEEHRILIVEDSPTQAAELQLVLDDAGFTVDSAEDGQQGWDLVRSSRYDLVLSDVMMPGLDGYELCRRIKADPATRHVPVMLLTTLSEASDIVRGLAAGADNYMTKPYAPEELLRRVGEILARKPDRSEDDGLGPPTAFLCMGERFTVRCNLEQALNYFGSTLEGFLESKRREYESKRAEEVARERAEIAAAFVNTMSHELRTPLHVILGYSDLLLSESFGELTSEQADVLRRLARNARGLADLVGTTLDLNRIEQGQLPLNVAETKIEELIEDLGREIWQIATKPEIRFQWNLETHPLRVCTDPSKLKVVLKNLVGNAIKFTDRGSVVVGVRQCRNGVQFSVMDTGIGIPSDAIPHIFESFRQVDGSITRRHGGLGLGLYVARRLVEMLGGSIDVRSEVGVGSTFDVWIPQTPPPAAPGAPRSRASNERAIPAYLRSTGAPLPEGSL